MAFFDWNHNGKKDFQDDYLEYKIYEKSTENSNNNSSGTSFGCLSVILIVLVFLNILPLFSQCTKELCHVPGCTSECTIDSNYCLMHDYYDSNYGNPTHYDEYREKKRKEEAEAKKEEETKYTPTSKPSSSSNSKRKKKTYDDPYDVNEYSSAEDFYDDNYCDFHDYEEAEDYYNSYHEDP